MGPVNRRCWRPSEYPTIGSSVAAWGAAPDVLPFRCEANPADSIRIIVVFAMRYAHDALCANRPVPPATGGVVAGVAPNPDLERHSAPTPWTPHPTTTTVIPELPEQGVVRGACPHDCPDTCAMLVTVERRSRDARRRRSRAPVHERLSVRQGQPLRRAHLPSRTACSARCDAWAPKEAAGSSRCRGTRRWRTIAARLTDDRAIAGRAAGDPAVLVRRHDGHGAGLVHGPPVLPPARRVEARPHDLLHGRHRGHAHDGRRQHRRRRRGRCRRATSCCCGARTRSPPTRTSGRSCCAARERGARVIAIDPIRTRTAEQCDEWIGIRPGTDAALALGMMHVIFARGLEDRDYLARHTLGEARAAGTRSRIPAGSRGRDHGARPGNDRATGRAVRPRAGRVHPRELRPAAARRRRHGGAHDRLPARGDRTLAPRRRRRAALDERELSSSTSRRSSGPTSRRRCARST